MPLFQRTIKLVLSTLLAIFLAETLRLTYATSAGIIAILSLLDTRKSSLTMAFNRLFSTLLALSIATLVCGIFGFDLWVLGLYLAIYVPFAYYFKWEAGIAPSTVLVGHLFLEKSISPNLLVNEIALFVIGASIALSLNLYMPSKEKEIAQYHAHVEQLLKQILHRFEHFLLSGNGSNDAQLINQLDATLSKALKTVYLDRHNQLFHQTNYQVHYFEMRQAQNNILKRMAEHINGCHLEGHESIILASLFEQTAQQLSRENPAQELLGDIDHFLETFRERPLPKNRQEFETRAKLFQLLHDMEAFIQLKVDFYQAYQNETKL